MSVNVPSTLRKMNKSLVLNIIREDEPISRAQIAAITKLTRASVSQIVNDLIEDGLIYEAEGTIPGRKGIALRFNRSYGYTVGIDIGGTKISLGMFNFNGDMLNKDTVATFQVNTSKHFIHLLLDTISSFIRKSNIPLEKLLAIGVASPGIIDYKNGVVIEGSPNLPEWENIHLSKEIENVLGVPTFLENDVRAALIGEFWKGKCKRVQSASLISLGTGIGSALLVDGNIIRGAGYGAGEIGYFLFSREHLNHDWGNKGCFESLISGSGLANQNKSKLKKVQDNSLKSTKEIFQDAREGESYALELVDQFVDYLAIAINNVIATVNPEKIVLTGGISSSADIFLEKVNEKVNKHTFEQNRVEIEVSELFEEAALYGISILALNSIQPSIKYLNDLKII